MNTYSEDLRWKVVRAYENKEGTQLSISKRFSVSRYFVNEIWNHYKRRDHVTPKAHGGGNPGKFTKAGYSFLKKLLKKEPDLYLHELATRYDQKFGVSVSHTAVNDALKRMELTRKKRLIMPLNQKLPKP